MIRLFAVRYWRRSKSILFEQFRRDSAAGPRALLSTLLCSGMAGGFYEFFDIFPHTVVFQIDHAAWSQGSQSGTEGCSGESGIRKNPDPYPATVRLTPSMAIGTLFDDAAQDKRVRADGVPQGVAVPDNIHNGPGAVNMA